MRSAVRVRNVVVAAATVGAVVAGSGVGQATALDKVRLADDLSVAPGITYRAFSVTGSHGVVSGHLVTADLTNRHVSVDLLTPGTVSSRVKLSQMAAAQGAVAGVNADFFNIEESQHAGVAPTNSAVGPAVSHGEALKAAVPDGQRFGPGLPPGTSTREVIGVGSDKRARLDELTLAGSVRTKSGSFDLGGFNQYAIPVGGVGAFTPKWGDVSRQRSVCGTDTVRAAACSTDTYEVTVRDGRVVSGSSTIGAGAIAEDTEVLVGREAGADRLRALRTGDRVKVSHRLESASGKRLRCAVGGFPVLRDGEPLPGLDTKTAATRTGAGVGDHGRRLYLLVLDGSAESGAGLTVAEVADVLDTVGADAGVNLDGGGSSTLVTRDPETGTPVVRNHPTGGAERPVPEGIGLFSR
ncbi:MULTISPECIES: phosphodiester glycosidase family protein [unclassified Streptomyces]|uniref:phosphodiester glycosidase family protein n=1 Tax=unclassified Streptomyces TaxID=2593676 RepID=UPI002E342052|nr:MULTISPECIES: phosphodiester glycosidase family protein [unclassified Streptomyces]